MNTTPTDPRAGADLLITAARNGDEAAARASANMLKPELLPATAANLASAFVDLHGPRDLTHEDIRAASLAFIAAVEADLDDDIETVERLHPDNYADAYMQLNTARRMLADVIGTFGEVGRSYLAGARHDLIEGPSATGDHTEDPA